MKRDKLRRARLKKGLSQEVASGLLGISRTTWSMWETGMSHPYPMNVKDLCAFFGVSDPADLDLEPAEDEPLHTPQISPSRNNDALTQGKAEPTPSSTISPARELFSTLPVQSFNPLSEGTVQTERTWGQVKHDMNSGSRSFVSFPLEEYNEKPFEIQKGFSSHMLLETPFLELQATLSQATLPALQKGKNEAILLSRRQALLAIASLTLPLLASPQKSFSLLALEELLSSLQRSIDACWQLSNEFDIIAIHSIISTYLPSLAALAEQPSAQQKVAAHLTAQAFLLKAIIERHLTSLRAAEKACQEAIFYSERAGDPVLRLATVRHLAMIYYYAGRHTEELALYQQMLPYLSHETVPPLVQSFIYAGWAGTQALNDLEHEAHVSLALARERFSQQSTTDQTPLYIDYNASQLSMSEGLTYYDLGDYEKAQQTFLEVDGVSPKIPVAERGRLEFINCQTMTLLHLPEQDRDMQQCIAYWTAALEGARRLKSRQRFDEVCRIYECMHFVWPREKPITKLQELMMQ